MPLVYLQWTIADTDPTELFFFFLAERATDDLHISTCNKGLQGVRVQLLRSAGCLEIQTIYPAPCRNDDAVSHDLRIRTVFIIIHITYFILK